MEEEYESQTESSDLRNSGPAIQISSKINIKYIFNQLRLVSIFPCC